MDSLGLSGFTAANSVMKKRRSVSSRRPRPDTHPTAEGHDMSPPSSTPSSDNTSKRSPDDNTGYDSSSQRKELSLNTYVPKVASINKIESSADFRKFKKDEKKFGALKVLYKSSSSRGEILNNSDKEQSASDLKRCTEGVVAPTNWKSASGGKETKINSRSLVGYVGKSNGRHDMDQSIGALNRSAENESRKVRLKVGGVTRTVHAKSNLESGKIGLHSEKPLRSADASRHRQMMILQDMSDDDYPPPEKANDLQGASRKDFNGGCFSRGEKEDSHSKSTEKSMHVKEKDKHQSITFVEPVRKSKRVPKRRTRESSFRDGDEDDEIRYLERLKTSKSSVGQSVEHEDDDDSVKKRKISKVSQSRRSAYDVDVDYSMSRSNNVSRRKLKAVKQLDDTDYIEEEEHGSDDELDAKERKLKKESPEQLTYARAEPLMTRRRALQSSKAAGESLIEFPDGLPPAPTRKQKEKLTEEEQQARKAEAAQRRKMQVEKAARESEAEAIKKILGQDSSRKKKEEKIRKERDEMAQKRAAESLTLASNSIRWVMGPTGTIVTFSEDVGLPSIFNSKQCSYPPPREKCAAPCCTNAYKYRDSKSNLPLCSLECYRAMQGGVQPVSTC
ncbi:uncharacterized protein [Typha latifolia]|uniref:uncharacterized protein n=1 Tax=Typha latifolia TaxID=4733 RepID=UPI003C2C5418